MTELLTKFHTNKHAYKWGDGTTALLRNFSDKNNKVYCEAVFASNGGIMYSGTLDLLMAASTQKTFAKALAENPITNAPFDEWRTRIVNLSYTSVEEYRRGGEEFLQLNQTQPETSAAAFALEPFIAQEGISLLYGNGAAGKSMLALTMLLSISSGEPILGSVPGVVGKTAYYDFEDGVNTHAERLHALAQGFNVSSNDVYYRRMDRSLVHSQERILDEIEEHDLKAVVIDSLGMGAGGDPSDAALILQAMNVCKSFNIPVLTLSHLAKSALGENASAQAEETSYGSVYAGNSVRNQWLIKKKQDEEEDPIIYLKHTKVNRGPKRPVMAYEVEFDNDESFRLLSAKYTQVSASAYSEDMQKESDEEGDKTIRAAVFEVFKESETASVDVQTIRDSVAQKRNSPRLKDSQIRRVLTDGEKEGWFEITHTVMNKKFWGMNNG